MDPANLLTSNLEQIERAIAFACRRCRFDRDECEEFASVVKLRLIENDYAVLRSFAELSSFQAFIGVVVQRMALDYRTQAWGKWHASAEAKRLGPLAMRLEEILHRDRRTLDDAVTILGGSREELQALADRLPSRAPRHRSVPLEEADPVAANASV
ncbi:MAG TPA: hypothetical protein VF698_17500, partial [Thermoanaerobaculia bacterium]